MTAFRTLKTESLEKAKQIVSSETHQILTLDSPAAEVVTYFKMKRPALLEPDLAIDEALMVMRKSHVRSVLVVDTNENFLGLLTLADLESRKVLATAENMGIKRAELSVRDLMTPKSALSAIPLKSLADARVGDLLKTLQDLGKPHVLLSGESDEIAGIISASDIARKLHIDINICEKVTSFAEIYGVVSKGRDI